MKIGRLFSQPHFQTPRRELKILCTTVQTSIFDELRGAIWKCAQTVSSQSNLKLRRKLKNKIAKIYAF